ncbi:MAG: hypothetical protein ACRYF4_05415 [Janthinobacterium lividum]
MKRQLAFALVFAATPALAQQTGVSHPPDVLVEDSPLQAAKPSAAIPIADPTTEVYQPYRPEVSLHTRGAEPVDPDAGIVTEVPRHPNELAAGTALRMRLRTAIDTELTRSNTPFTGDLTENVTSEGRVILPVGSTVEGTITQVRGGRRIRGAALIHLQAQAVLLPDGTRIPLHAEVIDTDQFAHTRVDEEGNILRKDHVGATLAAMSLTTGGAAAAGAVLGGGVGALVGAGVGAGLSTAWWLKQDRQTHLPQDALIVLGLTEPLQTQSLVREPNFSASPARVDGSKGAAEAYTPATPIYTAPQSFVPVN